MVTESDIREALSEKLHQSDGNCSSMSALEEEIDRQFSQIAREMLQRILESLEELEPAPTTRCRWCGNEARYVSNRLSSISTRFGQVRYRRAYYVCRHCFHSTAPLDERLNPYQSLARLRAQIEAGNFLPVDEMARSWGLGCWKLD